MEVTHFGDETVDVHRTSVVGFISSASDALELGSRAIVEVLRSTERGDTASGVNPDSSFPSRSFVVSTQFLRHRYFLSRDSVSFVPSFLKLSFHIASDSSGDFYRRSSLYLQYRLMKC